MSLLIAFVPSIPPPVDDDSEYWGATYIPTVVNQIITRGATQDLLYSRVASNLIRTLRDPDEIPFPYRVGSPIIGPNVCIIAGPSTAPTVSDAAVSYNDGVAFTDGAIANNIWAAAAYNGSIMVVVEGYGWTENGNNSQVAATSYDGLNWTVNTTALPSARPWRRVIWAGGSINLFVCMSLNGGVVATSPDGLVWTSHTLSAVGDMSAIGFNGTIITILPQNNGTQGNWSSDGIAWTSFTLPDPENYNDVCWNGHVFCTFENARQISLTSADGKTWTRRSNLSTSAHNWHNICAQPGWMTTAPHPGRILITSAGETFAAYSDDDGVTFTDSTLPFNGNENGLVFDGNVFIITENGSSNRIATSPDGVTWTIRTTLPSSKTWYGAILTFNNPVQDEFFFMQSLLPASVQASLYRRLPYLPDPEEIPAGSLVTPPADAGFYDWQDLDLLLAGGGVGLGPPWPVPAKMYVQLPLLPDPEELPAGSFIGPSPVTFWDFQDLDPLMAGGGVELGPRPVPASMYVQLPILPDVQEHQGNLYNLLEEEYWQNPTAPVSARMYIEFPVLPDPEELPAGQFIDPHIRYGSVANAFLAIGPNANDGSAASITLSREGTTWETPYRSLLTSGMDAVAFGNGKWVILGSDGTNNGMVSTDGRTWVRNTTSPTSCACLTSDGTTFCAIRNTDNKSYTSTDGVTWTSHALPANASGWSSIVWNGSKFLIVGVDTGSGAQSATSSDGATWAAGGVLPTNAGCAWKVTWNGTVYCATANGGSATNSIATSPTGATWTGHNPPASTAGAGNDITARTIDGTIVIVGYSSSGSSGFGAYSTDDGSSWTAMTLFFGWGTTSVEDNNNRFVALPTTGGNAAAICSNDGINWFAVDSTGLYANVAEKIRTGTLTFPVSPDEDFWQNPVFPVLLRMGSLYRPDPEELPAGSFISPLKPDEDFWQNWAAPIPRSMYVQLPYMPDPEEISARTLFGQDDEDFYWNQFWGTPRPVQGAMYIVFPVLPDPEELSANTFFGRDDEDFLWSNFFGPPFSVSATINPVAIPQWRVEQHDVPLPLSQDEDYLLLNSTLPPLSVAAPLYVRPPLLPDPEEIPTGFLTGQPDEDFDWRLLFGNPFPIVASTTPVSISQWQWDVQESATTLAGEPDEDFDWNRLLGSPRPVLAGMYIEFPLMPDPEEIPATQLFGQDDEDFSWSVLFGAPFPAQAVTNPLSIPRWSSDVQEPAATLTGQPDEDFDWRLWLGAPRPVPASMYLQLPVLPDPEELPATQLRGQPDEDFDPRAWLGPPWSIAAALYQRLPYLPDPEEVPAGSLVNLQVDEIYWQNWVRSVPGSMFVRMPLLPDPEEIPAGNLTQTLIPEEDFDWRMLRGSPRPIVASMFVALPYLPDPEEMPAASLFGQPDEDFDWNRLLGSPRPVPASMFVELPILPDPEELPVGFLFGQDDEDFWVANARTPWSVQASLYQRLPYLPDPEEIAAGALSGQPDEDFWALGPPYAVLAMMYQRLPILPDPEEIPAALLSGQAEEIYWINSVAPMVASIYQPLPLLHDPDGDYSPPFGGNEDFWTPTSLPQQEIILTLNFLRIFPDFGEMRFLRTTRQRPNAFIAAEAPTAPNVVDLVPFSESSVDAASLRYANVVNDTSIYASTSTVMEPLVQNVSVDALSVRAANSAMLTTTAETSVETVSAFTVVATDA